MDRCLRVTYRYHDTDVVEVEVSARNKSFSGSTCLYVGQGELGNVARLLTGFPTDVTDTREVVLGAFGLEYAGGAMKLQLSCSDGAGHCGLSIAIEADYKSRASRAERVELSTQIEPAALDLFVEQMHRLDTFLTGSAVLFFA